MIETSSSQTLIVGSYTKSSPAGINIYRLITDPIRFELIDQVEITNASYGSISDDKQFLYFVNETGDVDDRLTALKRNDAGFTVLNTVSSGGSGPCYISVNKTLSHAFTANYNDGALSAVALNSDGSFSGQIQTIRNVGSGPDERQECAHMHCVALSPDEQYLFAVDLGIDQIDIYSYQHDITAEPLKLSSSTKLPAGTGPRHLIFSPDGRIAYVISEFFARIHVFDWNAGQLNEIQVISMGNSVAPDFNSAADLHISPNGKYLYASNRASVNQIAVFGIDEETGLLTYLNSHDTMGTGPRNFAINRAGTQLLVAHQHSNDVRVFTINQDNGSLNYTGISLSIPNPVFLKFI